MCILLLPILLMALILSIKKYLPNLEKIFIGFSV